MGTTLHTLSPAKGANRPRKRVGRGHGSGTHKTAGKGQKGQKARTGHHGIPKPGFEGGQSAMARRLPKRGFTNARFKKEISIVNLGELEGRFQPGRPVDVEALKERDLVPPSARLVKVLGDGKFTSKLTVRAHFFSQSALAKLQQLGGAAEVIAQPGAPASAPEVKA